MINFVLKKFVKNLNSVSLSVDERAALRRDFLARTGLPDSVKKPSLKSSFVLALPEANETEQQGQVVGKVNFELQLVEERFSQAKVKKRNLESPRTKVRAIDQNVVIKVSLNVVDGKKNFVLMKVSRL